MDSEKSWARNMFYSPPPRNLFIEILSNLRRLKQNILFFSGTHSHLFYSNGLFFLCFHLFSYFSCMFCFVASETLFEK